MTSKSSFFKLLFEAMKSRLWAIALTGLAFFFTYPVAVSMMMSNRSNRDHYSYYMDWFMFGNGLVVFLVVVASVIIGMSSFGYLNSKSKVDFYHSLPVRREKLYVVNYIAGILIFAIPYAIMLVAGAFIVTIQGGVWGGFWLETVAGYLLNMVYYSLMYTVVIIAVMMTGNRIVAYLGVMVFNFLIPCVSTVIRSFYMVFFVTWSYNTYYDIFWSWHISPFMEYIEQAVNYRDGGFSLVAVVVAVAVTLLGALLGGVLYRQRPSEAAGKAMVFEITKPVIRVILVVLSAVSFGLLLWAIESSIGRAVFGIVCGGTVAHCVIEIIYHFELRKLFCHKRQLIGCLIVSFLFFCVFRFDWFGYDRYLPTASQVKNAAATVPGVNSWTSYGEIKHDDQYIWVDNAYIFEHMNGVDTNLVLMLAEDGIFNAQEVKRDRSFMYTGSWPSIEVCYTLNSGRKVYRTYIIDYADMKPVLAELYLQRGFKAGVYPVMNLDAAEVAEIRYREWEPETRLSTLTESERAALLAAYQKDLEQLSIEQLETELPLGLIRFVTNAELPALNENDQKREEAERDNRYYSDYNQFDERNFYPVYRSFTNTCQLLSQYGIDPGDDLMQYETEYYSAADLSESVYSYTEDELSYQIGYETAYAAEYQFNDRGGQDNVPVFSSEAEIEALDAIAVPSGMSYYNSLCPAYELTCYKKQGDSNSIQEINVVIPRDQAPDFIAEQMETNETVAESWEGVYYD